MSKDFFSFAPSCFGQGASVNHESSPSHSHLFTTPRGEYVPFYWQFFDFHITVKL